MQKRTFVYKSSRLSTRAQSIVYENVSANPVSFVDELFTNETAGNHMKKARLTHIVTFRLDSEQWEQLQAVSQASQQKPNDWARDLTTQTLAPGIGLKPIERFLFEQFARAVPRYAGFSTAC